MDIGHFWILTKPAIIVIAGQLPALAISLGTSWLVAHLYFKRQRKIDENIERKEVLLFHKKLFNAYITELGKKPKVGSFYAREAMEDLRARLQIYRPEYDADKFLKETLDEARKFIADHPDDFEDVPQGRSLR